MSDFQKDMQKQTAEILNDSVVLLQKMIDDLFQIVLAADWTAIYGSQLTCYLNQGAKTAWNRKRPDLTGKEFKLEQTKHNFYILQDMFRQMQNEEK